MMAQLEDVGAVICAAGSGLAPADKKLYALRDVTGTVEAIPLIASSIMSKKIAEGTGALVLDVKVGSGAFMKSEDEARELAETMVALGTDAGVTTVALLTDMSTPLGLTAGNAVEVAESVEVLAGGGPADVVELTLALAREMLAAAGKADVDPAEALADGRAMDVWRRMIAAQGGDPDAALPQAQETHVVTAPTGGTLTRLDALGVGVAAWRLGAGRSRPGEQVQAGAGVVMHAKPGDTVSEGAPLHDPAHRRARRGSSARWRRSTERIDIDAERRIGPGRARPASCSTGLARLDAMRVLNNRKEIAAASGKELGVSEWVQVTQERIDPFADATGDRQWIHVDPERAANGPFGATIAHGYLTLSMLPFLSAQVYAFAGDVARVNYGLNKVRFVSPVVVGSKVRNRVEMVDVKDLDKGQQITLQHTIEIKGADKPACVAETVTLLMDAG